MGGKKPHILEYDLGHSKAGLDILAVSFCVTSIKRVVVFFNCRISVL